MMLCPACQRVLDDDTETCPRCGTELATLHAVQASAERHIQMGTLCLQRRKTDQALRHFRAACQITPTTEARQGHAVAAMCSGRFHEALRAYLSLESIRTE